MLVAKKIPAVFEAENNFFDEIDFTAYKSFLRYISFIKISICIKQVDV